MDSSLTRRAILQLMALLPFAPSAAARDRTLLRRPITCADVASDESVHRQLSSYAEKLRSADLVIIEGISEPETSR
jgi:hypothetical protein